MVTNALSRGSSRRARSAAVKLILRRAVASSVGQSGMRAQVDIAFEFTGKLLRPRAAGRAVDRGRNTCPVFRLSHRIAPRTIQRPSNCYSVHPFGLED